MSGAIGLNIIPVTANVEPKEGSKACTVKVSWANTNPFGIYDINLLQQYNSGQFVDVQSVFIDNSTCPYQVSLTNSQTGHTVNCPPFAQGMFPIITTHSPSYVATLVYVTDYKAPPPQVIQNCTTKFLFLNSPQVPFLNEIPEYGNNYGNTSILVSVPSGANNAILHQIVPAAGSNIHYLINSLTFSPLIDPANAAQQSVLIFISEMGSSTDGQPVSSTSSTRLIASATVPAGLNTGQSFIQYFDTPLLTFLPNNGVGFFISEPDTIPANLSIGITLNYGTVLIA
jgi:hypothetical protein